MIKWRRIISLALLLALFLAPLMQAAAMNSASGMVGMTAMTERVATAPDGHHERQGSHHAHQNKAPEAQEAASDCHGSAGVLDCCAHCGGCGIPVSVRFAFSPSGVAHFRLPGVPPQPVLEPQKRPPRIVS